MFDNYRLRLDVFFSTKTMPVSIIELGRREADHCDQARGVGFCARQAPSIMPTIIYQPFLHRESGERY